MPENIFLTIHVTHTPGRIFQISGSNSPAVSVAAPLRNIKLVLFDKAPYTVQLLTTH